MFCQICYRLIGVAFGFPGAIGINLAFTAPQWIIYLTVNLLNLSVKIVYLYPNPGRGLDKKWH